MSFIRPEERYYERKVLGSGCDCVHSLNPIHPRYYGHGISDVLDKVLSPSTATTISKIVSSVPKVYETIKNVINSDPQELNKGIQEALEKNPSSFEDVIKSINSKEGKGKRGTAKRKHLLNNHSQMILNNLLGSKKGSGLQTM